MHMPIKSGLVLLGASLFALNAAAFAEPQGHAKLPVTFSPEAKVNVVVEQQGNAIIAKLPKGKTQTLGEMPDVPEGGQTHDLLLQDDFNFDGYGDVAVLNGVGYSGVNLFYRLHLWNKAQGKFQEYQEPISNPTLTPETKTLSTAQRSGPRWYSTDYRFNKGKPYVWSEGATVGTDGDLIFVKIYDSAGKVLKKVIANTQDSSDVTAKTPAVTRQITVDKAVLYNKPDAKTKTKMYLIKGDKVTLLDHREGDDYVEWFLVRFDGKKRVEKWVESSALSQ